SILTVARRTAAVSTTPGTSASVRSAISNAVASAVVSRSGRRMPASSVTVTVSPAKERSIRPPGPCPGRPHTHGTSRSPRPPPPRVHAPQPQLELPPRSAPLHPRPDPPAEPPQPVRPTLGHPHPRGADDRRRLDPAPHHGEQVDVDRHPHRPRRADRPHRPD